MAAIKKKEPVFTKEQKTLALACYRESANPKDYVYVDSIYKKFGLDVFPCDSRRGMEELFGECNYAKRNGKVVVVGRTLVSETAPEVKRASEDAPRPAAKKEPDSTPTIDDVSLSEDEIVCPPAGKLSFSDAEIIMLKSLCFFMTQLGTK